MNLGRWEKQITTLEDDSKEQQLMNIYIKVSEKPELKTRCTEIAKYAI